MGFGFGFNKTKILSSAERNVKQGKLQNAIADYEKIIKEDPKDLTVLNTIGDLYARTGNTEKAFLHFRRVGDAYATDGFTVKAIALYKKLTKLNPSATDCLLKLADFYSQQGLYNDARSQYMQVAEQHMRSGEIEKAATVFQKMVELDPENTGMQNKLAELYVRLGKKTQARDIFFRAAEALRARGALDAAGEALSRVISLDPSFTQALLIRSQINFDQGDAKGAIHCLEQIPDIDSRLEGLRTLLQAHLKLGQLAQADPIARKLFTVFNETSGITLFADALMAAGECENALRLYNEYAERLLSTDSPTIVRALASSIGHFRDSSRALQMLCDLFQKAGEGTHLAEVTELLAHSYVQEGDLHKARDLYRKLSEMEPENPLHPQNYKQVLAKLGEESTVRELTPEEGGQAFMVDELEQAIPVLQQKYSPEMADAIRAALTDSELFDSYNLPGRAIQPLEAILSKVPTDAQINQRLASLYARAGRYQEAAACCKILYHVHAESGFVTESRQYAEMATKYWERAGVTPEVLEAPEPVTPAHTAPEHDASHREFLQSAVNAGADEFARFEPPVASTGWRDQQQDAQETFSIEASAQESPVASLSVQPPLQQFPALDPGSDVLPEAHEIDLSEEWDRMVTNDKPRAQETQVEPVPDAPAQTLSELSAAPVVPIEALPTGASGAEVFDILNDVDGQVVDAESSNPVADLVEEIKFYISQSMWDEAHNAILRCEVMAPDFPLDELRNQLANGERAELDPAVRAVEPEIELISEIESQSAVVPERGQEFAFDSAVLDGEFPPVDSLPTLSLETELDLIGTEPTSISRPEPLSIFEPEPLGVVDEITPVRDAAPEVDIRQFEPAKPQEREFSGFVMDLDESLGEGFNLDGKSPATVRPVVGKPVVAVPSGVPTTTPAAPVAAPPKAPAPVEVAPQSPVEQVSEDETTSALSDIFAEFKQDMESGPDQTEDPETHYNLGVAFKEMGLFDEAIGELQKVCQSIDRGHAFPQVMQAYTWLADCFVQKGVPEAGIRWYEKSLKIRELDDETSTAIHYELACAYEAAGNKQAALSHFMEVYGSNIDYRDVAERIKALKS